MQIFTRFKQLPGVFILVISLGYSHLAIADTPHVSASHDGVNLNLQMHGHFKKGSHAAFFIDSDNNPKTGYRSKGNLKGVDYLVQSNGLYKYPKGAKGWKWEKVTSSILMTKSLTKVTARIPLKFVDLGNTIRFKGQIASKNWRRFVYSQQKKFRIDSQIKSIVVSNNGADLVLKMKGRFLKGGHPGFYLDVDNNPLTGYVSKGKKRNIRGADFLIEAGGLYQYPKGAHGWKWKKVSSNILMDKSIKEVRVRIPLKLLHAGNTIQVKAEMSSKNWHHHVYSNNVVYHVNNSSILIGNSSILISDEKLKIALSRSKQGLGVRSIKVNGTEVLSSTSDLFTLSIDEINNLNSHKGWGSVTAHKKGDHVQVVFTRPQTNNLPARLKVIATIQVKNGKSFWDLGVTGLKDHSLMDVSFPRLNIKADGNDHFFVPNRFGQVFDNPGYGMPQFKEIYPMGWGASMQYMAYYNDKYGLYFGSHDPKASLKTLAASGKSGRIAVHFDNPVPNRTLKGNGWDFPGLFELAAYKGDWYDAALIYKDWVYRKANYRPPAKRPERARKLGNISVWSIQNIYGDVHSGNGHTAKELGDSLESLRNALNSKSQPVTLGMYWLSIHDAENEENMPKLYPSDDAKYLVNRFKGQGVPTMLYGNGYLYDLDIRNADLTVPEFSKVKKYAAKKLDGSLYTQGWVGHTFARMCSTQKGWQDILSKVHGKFVAPLGTSGVFLDQITASTPVQCYDKSHGHPLGGGHYWRDGYKKLIEAVRSKYPSGTFVISEAVNDSLMDTLDGYEVQNSRYLIDNQVPAMQVVYGGKVQFIGPQSGAASYEAGVNSEGLYGMSAYAFAMGSTQGYFYPQMASNTEALGYVRKLARLREKLKSYIAFGEMMRPIDLHGSVPQVTISRGQNSTDIPAIQAGVWRSKDKHSVAVAFINGQTPGNPAISFSTNFNAGQYGLKGRLSIKRVSENGEKMLEAMPSQVTLQSADAVAFVITQK